jgi:hypothetical protein
LFLSHGVSQPRRFSVESSLSHGGSGPGPAHPSACPPSERRCPGSSRHRHTTVYIYNTQSVNR